MPLYSSANEVVNRFPRTTAELNNMTGKLAYFMTESILINMHNRSCVDCSFATVGTAWRGWRR